MRLSAEVVGARSGPSGIELTLAEGETVSGALLLVATGRAPSTQELDLSAAGVAVRDDGRIRVDEFGRTTADGVWALGDVSSTYQLKHVANAEARHGRGEPRRCSGRHRNASRHAGAARAVRGLHRPSDRDGRRDIHPARGPRCPPTSSARSVTATPLFGWALEDRSSFCRLYGDPDTRKLLGAHLIGPDAAALIQPLITGIAFGLPRG